MTFAGVANHARLTLVCWVVVFYMGLDNYPMMMVSTGMWLYEGQVEVGYDLHTGGLTQHSLVPMVCASDNALSLHPLRLHFSYLVDLCSEIGGLSQGAIVDAWVVAVAVHHCLLTAGFYEQACAAPGLCGVFGASAVSPDIWRLSYGVSIWLFGFSCHPFSGLGDGRGPHDARDWGRPMTLNAANSTQPWIMMLGSVSPAGAGAAVNPNVMMCNGNPGPVRIGSLDDGCAVPHLHLGCSGLYQRTMWVITVLMQSQHRLVGFSIQADRWYGDAVARQLDSWSWFSLQDCTCPLVWVPHFQLCIDFILCMGSPGLVHLGSGKDGSDMVNLHLRGFGSKRRTMWFITVLKAWLRHRQIRLTMGHGRSAPHRFLFHIGVLAFPWPSFHLPAVVYRLQSFCTGSLDDIRRLWIHFLLHLGVMLFPWSCEH